MEKPEQKFSPNARVRLREGVDPGFYNGYSRAGQEAWIRRRKLDKYGYPQVLVEWDQDHWAYNNQPDGWTWEGHFEAVEGAMSEESTQPDQEAMEQAIREVTGTFVKSLFAIIRTAQGQEGESLPEASEQEIPEEDNWDERAKEAAHAVLNAEAYVVLAVDQRQLEEGGPTVIMPYIFQNAKDEELGAVCQSQLGHLVAAMQDQFLQVKFGGQGTDV